METQSKTLITIIVLVVLALAGGMYLRSQQSLEVQAPIEEETTFCTMDAMQCPDGSYVGRTGPDCEFVCPE